MKRGPVLPSRRGAFRWAYAIKLRMVLLFLLLAAAMSFVFISGAQKAFTVGWRDAAKPLLVDYVDRLVVDITAGGSSPNLARAQALSERLPLTVRISGPQVNWASHPEQGPPAWMRDRAGEAGREVPSWASEDLRGPSPWPSLLQRQTADGHRVELGVNTEALERRPRLVGFTLTALLVLTLLAWLYVRWQLKPLDAIGEGARRFGAGDFSQPIPDHSCKARNELGELATTINTMGRDIHQMLEAKRALLLAISHELRSPLTRARLHTELLPDDDAQVGPQREALLRDLQEMAQLISDLLESERLSGQHAALQREPTDLAQLVQDVAQRLTADHAGAESIGIHIAADLPPLHVDPTRIRLLVRNLLDNALRHGAGGSRPPEIHLGPRGDGRVRIRVRDYGPGVSDEHLSQLSQAFYRPDSARTRGSGGVGLGLTLCRLVAQAHGGDFSVRNAQPGLEVSVSLPAGIRQN